MRRSLVAFLLAALAAFSSLWFPQVAKAYGTAAVDVVTNNCYRITTSTTPYGGNYPSRTACYSSAGEAGPVDASFYVSQCSANPPGPGVTCASSGGSVSGLTYTFTFYTYRSDGSTRSTQSVTLSYSAVPVSTTDCQSPKVSVDGLCYCGPGTAPDSNGACVPYTCPSSGTVIPGTEDRTFSLNGPATENAFCVSGCLVTSSFSISYTDASGASHQEAAGPIRSTGQACNPAGQGGSQPSLGAAQPGQAPASAPAVCPAGQCPGTVNGVSVCAACSGMATGSVTTNAGQSGGTITSTDCSGGTCTTKTGTVDASGNVTWTSTTTGSGQNASNTPAGGTGATGNGSGDSQNQDQKSFCADNPDSIICKSSSWGGTCGGFTCSGDAVQCQIAKMQADMWCGTSQLPEGIQGKYDALTGEGQAPASFDDKVNLTLPTPEAATCAVQDMQIQFIGGVALNVPLSQMCQWLGYIHTIVVSFGVLMWVFIVFRGK